jgi:hypothetical protein
VTQADYTPVVQVNPSPPVYEDVEAELTPAVYTLEDDEDGPGSTPVYELAAVERAERPANVIRSAPPAEEPAVAGRSQGFEMVEAPAAGLF